MEVWLNLSEAFTYLAFFVQVIVKNLEAEEVKHLQAKFWPDAADEDEGSRYEVIFSSNESCLLWLPYPGNMLQAQWSITGPFQQSLVY